MKWRIGFSSGLVIEIDAIETLPVEFGNAIRANPHSRQQFYCGKPSTLFNVTDIAFIIPANDVLIVSPAPTRKDPSS